MVPSDEEIANMQDTLKRVLIVDENSYSQIALIGMFDKFSVKCDSCSDDEAAINMIEKRFNLGQPLW